MAIANLEGAATKQLKLQIGADSSQKLLQVVDSLMQALAGKIGFEEFITTLVGTAGGGGLLSTLQGSVSQVKDAWKACLVVLVTELVPVVIPVAKKVHAQVIQSASSVDPHLGEFVSSVFPTSAFDSIEIEPPAINTDAAPLVLLVQVLLRRLLSSQHEAIEELGNRVVNEAATGLDDISVYLDQVNPTPKDVTIDVPPAMGESAHSIEMGCVKYVSTI